MSRRKGRRSRGPLMWLARHDERDRGACPNALQCSARMSVARRIGQRTFARGAAIAAISLWYRGLCRRTDLCERLFLGIAYGRSIAADVALSMFAPFA